jgi:hypothetical protein
LTKICLFKFCFAIDFKLCTKSWFCIEFLNLNVEGKIFALHNLMFSELRYCQSKQILAFQSNLKSIWILIPRCGSGSRIQDPNQMWIQPDWVYTDLMLVHFPFSRVNNFWAFMGTVSVDSFRYQPVFTCLVRSRCA